MTRNKKYFTEEERAEAKRAAWRKWKEKTDRSNYMREYDAARPNKQERVAAFKTKRHENPEFWREYSNANYHKNNNNERPSNTREYKMWWAARKRANAKDIPFDIERSDVIIPEVCPCCQEQMVRPSLDKVKPELGYVKGNVAVICCDCNVIKSFGTSQRHRQIADWMDNFSLDNS